MSNTQRLHTPQSDLTSFLRESCQPTCRCLVLLALALVFLQPMFGQTGNSSVSGTVYDQSQAALLNATVILEEPLTGFHRQTKTDQTGYYKFPDLQPGNYVLKVTEAGFESYATTEFQLFVSQDVSMPVKLTVGSVTQQVIVASAPPLLDTESAAAGQVIESSDIVSLPLNGRDFLQLASLSAGTTPTPQQGSPASFATYISARANSSVFISGERESATSYLLDGIEMRDDRTGALTLQPSLDALAEFKVERSFFQADEGFHPAVVNVATKGGTNQFHGAAWEFVRNNDLDAKNYFSLITPALHQNQFGVTVGGPIIKNKLLFMFDYEGLRNVQGNTISAIYPTTAELSGDFSASNFHPIYDPASPGNRTQFPGNVIPSGRISPIAQNAIKLLIPKGITGAPSGVNDVVNAPQTQNDNQFIGRLDAPNLRVITHNDSVLFRVANLESALTVGGAAPLQAIEKPIVATNILLQLASPIRANTTNILRMGYQRDFSPALNQGAFTTNYASQIGLTNTTAYAPDFYPPLLEFTGYSNVGSTTAYNLNTLQNGYTLADNITFIKGKHTIETGFEERYARTFIDTGVYASGVLIFNQGFTSELNNGSLVAGTGDAIADFLLGYPEIGDAGVGSSSGHFHYAQYGFFGEDNWKATHDLELQFGFRYEPSTYPWPEQLNNYIFNQQNGTLLFPKLGEAPKGLLTSPRREFGPRVGLSWSPPFDQKTTVHAGGGVYFDMEQLNELQFQNYGPPFFAVTQFVQLGTTLTGANSFGAGVFPYVAPSVPTANYVPPHGTNLFSENPTNKTPTDYQWNLDIQHELGSKSLLEVGYFGAKGEHLSKRYSFNSCSGATDYLCVASRVPFPNIGYVLMSGTGGWSAFNSLQARFEQRLTQGLTALAGYTWGKSLDIDSGGAIGDSTERSACFRCDKALSDFNVSQRLVVSATYSLPFGRGKEFGANMPIAADYVVGGWQVAVISQFQTGVPEWVGASANTTGDNAVLNPRAQCVSTDIYGPGHGNLRHNKQWLNPAAFQNPAPGTFGNCSRSTYIGPGLDNFDMVVSKNFPIHDRVSLDFRAEAFNVFNHPFFNLPSYTVGSAVFGRVTSAGPPRIGQFALKLLF